MADTADDSVKVPAVEIQERVVPPGQVPGGPTDRLGLAIQAEERILHDGVEPRVKVQTYEDGRQERIWEQEAFIPRRELEQRRERLQGFRRYLTQQGERALQEQNQRIVAEHQVLQQDWEQLNSALDDLAPITSEHELGELGEMTADEYRERLNTLLQQQRQLLTRRRALQGQVEEHARRRKRGGLAIELEYLANEPAAADKFMDVLRGYEPFQVESWAPQFQDVDMDAFDSPRYKAQQRVNRAEDNHARLAERDARRGSTGITAQQLRDFPALRSRQR
jgi:hypothetical protein